MSRTGLTTAALTFLVVALIVVASVALMATRAGGTTRSAANQRTSQSTSAANGLRLSLAADPSVIYSGGTIAISISDFNTLLTSNAPAITGVPAVNGATLALGPCNQLPLGFGVYEGYYDEENISSASPLDMFQPGIVYSCSVEFNVAYFSFSPQSDNISLYSLQPSGSGNTTVPTRMWTNPDAFAGNFSGYWTAQNQAVLMSSAFHEFQPGVYTIVGGDDYGQLAIIHFYVQPSQTIAASTTEQSSTTGSAGENVSAASLHGLKLLVSMNATEVLPGETVQVTLSEFNTMPAVNNVSASKDWPVQVSLGSCSNAYDQPFGVAVYAGHVDGQNLSQGEQLRIFPIVPCPMYIRLVTGYEFQPLSDFAVVLPSSSGVAPSPLVGSVNFSMVYSPQTRQLSPGAYTVVAADEWSATTFLYFTVL
jgi:hypothetical protein